MVTISTQLGLDDPLTNKKIPLSKREREGKGGKEDSLLTGRIK